MEEAKTNNRQVMAIIQTGDNNGLSNSRDTEKEREGISQREGVLSIPS